MLGGSGSSADPGRRSGRDAAAGNDPISAPGPARWLLEGLRLSPRAPADVVYHGFISYSHAADGELAQALQKGLHRFAKPWYRTRALHVFRDESVLSANPQLWHSIALALAGSEHLILLASRKAAASEWVAREAEYWCTHKDPGKILICLTDGELAWDRHAGTVDEARTDALPEPLRDAFAEEPRYIDLRWATNLDDYSLTHPRWRESVAEVAAPLHHMPKEELAGEEVRQHRRTLRVARGVAAALLTLTTVAVVLGLVAYSQYHKAQARALAAEATVALQGNPENALSLALRSSEINASSSGTQALRLALAQAPQRVTIQSGAGADVQAAWSPTGTQIDVSGPHGQVQEWTPTGHVERVLSADGGEGEITRLSYSPDGTWIAAVTQTGAVEAWNAVTGQPVPTQDLNHQVLKAYSGSGAAVTRQGNQLYTSIVWSAADPNDLIAYGQGFDRVLNLDARTGAVTVDLSLPPGSTGVQQLVPSPDGTRLFLTVDGAGGVPTSAGYILDLGPDTAQRLSPQLEMSGDSACWTGDSRTIVTWNPNEAEDLNFRWWNGSSGKQVRDFPTELTITAAACDRAGSLSWAASGGRDGELTVRLGASVSFQLPAHRRYITALASSRNGDYLASASTDGTARVWNVRTGTDIRTLNDGDAVTSVGFSPDGGLALTTDQRGLVRIWDTGVGEPVTGLQMPSLGQTFPLGFAAGGRLVFGLNVVMKSHGYVSKPSQVRARAVAALLWSSQTGRLRDRVALPSDVSVAQAATRSCDPQGRGSLPCPVVPPTDLVQPVPSGAYEWGLIGAATNGDGSEIAYASPDGVGIVNPRGHAIGGLSLGQPPTGLTFSSRQLIVMTDQAIFLRSLGAPGRTLKLAQPSPPVDAEVSADGSRLVVGDFDGTVTVWDMSTGARIASFRVTRALAGQVERLAGIVGVKAPTPVRVAINSDGSEIAAGTSWQTVFLWNVDQHRLMSRRLIASTVDRGLGAQGLATAGGYNGPWAIDQLGFSADGSRLLATDFPYYTAGDARAPVTAAVLSASGSPVASYQSTDVAQGAIEPGDALAPGGDFLLGGAMDLGLGSAASADAVYQVSTGEQLLGLGSADQALGGNGYDWPTPMQPWAANGINVLAGEAIYACDACGSLAQMQQAARIRIAWLRPLSVAHDQVPPGDPYR